MIGHTATTLLWARTAAGETVRVDEEQPLPAGLADGELERLTAGGAVVEVELPDSEPEISDQAAGVDEVSASVVETSEDVAEAAPELSEVGDPAATPARGRRRGGSTP